MSLLESLYREAVLEHARRPRNRGRLDDPTVRQQGSNPSCGDELELELAVGDGRVEAAAFTGHGCAISVASASMMTELVRGRRVDDARALVARFKDMVHGRGVDPSLGDAAVLEGVAKLHARVKCATLPWVTLEEALRRADAQAAEGSSASPSSDSAPVVSTESGAAETAASGPEGAASEGSGDPSSGPGSSGRLDDASD